MVSCYENSRGSETHVTTLSRDRFDKLQYTVQCRVQKRVTRVNVLLSIELLW